MRSALLGLALAAGGVAHAGDCVAPTRDAQLLSAISNADSAYANMDSVRFSASAAYVRPILNCMVEPISPAAAAAAHRHFALEAWLGDDTEYARAEYRASWAIESTALPEAIAPVGSPLALLYIEAHELGGGDLQQVYTEAGLSLWVDGAPSHTLPAERPAIVQLVGADGAVRLTTLHPPGAALPIGLSATPVAAPVDVTDHAIVVAPPPPPHHPVGLLVGAGASLLVAGGLYGWSAVTHSAYNSPDTPDAEAEGLIGVNHGAVLAAGGLAVVGLGLGAVVAVKW